MSFSAVISIAAIWPLISGLTELNTRGGQAS